MPSLKLYDNQGKEAGELQLSDSLFGIRETRTRTIAGESIELSRDLIANLHQTVVAEEANQRQGTHKTKGRSEVSGGGRKPYRQKKTGRARQGSIRAPHWKGGGVVFGPTPRSYRQRLNRKARRLAIQSALAYKIADGALVAVDGVRFERIKTKDAVSFLKVHGCEGVRTLVLLPEHDDTALRCFRNIPNVELRFAPAVSARDVVVARRIVADRAALQKLEELWSK